MHFFSYVAQSERLSIRNRQAEELTAVKALRKIRFGNPEIALAENFSEINRRWKKVVSFMDAAKLCGMGVTISYHGLRE